jgi:C4-dicarboxylate-specific signal transduction histidine kinase
MRAYTAPQSPTYAHESLKDIVDEAAALVGDNNRIRGIGVDIDVRVPPTVAVEVDRGRIVQAFTNLLYNATEAYDGLQGRPPVVVEAIEEGTRATITFQDAGCGMSEGAVKDAATLFSTNKRHGTGFGLPLAIKIVESEHGGQLLMTSEQGTGTRVEVRLPKLRGKRNV